MLAPKPNTLRFLFLAVLFSGTSYASAQAYQPMFLDSVQWHFYIHTFVSEDYRQSVLGDTIVNGLQYKKLRIEYLQTGADYPMELWREDTTAREVFRLYNGTEYLVYDYGMLIGDTITVGHSALDDTPGTVEVSLDSLGQAIPVGVSCSLTTPRFYYLHRIDAPFSPVVWLESVGSLSGLTSPAGGWSINQDVSLTLCHSDQAGVRDYEVPQYQSSTDSCIGIVDDSSIPEHRSPITLLLRPNPSMDRSTVFFAEAMYDQPVIAVLDALGRDVQRIRVPNGSRSMDLDLSAYLPGVYLILLSNGSGAFGSARLVMQ